MTATESTVAEPAAASARPVAVFADESPQIAPVVQTAPEPHKAVDSEKSEPVAVMEATESGAARNPPPQTESELPEQRGDSESGNVVASDTQSVAREQAGGWKMEPIELPAGMELVETKSDAVYVVAEASAETQPARSQRRRKPVEHSVTEEPLVQIETEGAQTANSTDNA
jgi:hypothetical protein